MYRTDRLLTVSRVAAMTGMTGRQVYRATYDGAFPLSRRTLPPALRVERERGARVAPRAAAGRARGSARDGCESSHS